MRRLFAGLVFLLFGISIVVVFNQWFFSPVLTGGDFWHYFPSMYTTVTPFQYGWISEAGNGLGGVASVYQPIRFIFALSIYLFAYLFHMPWEVVARVGFFFPFLLFGLILPFFLFRKVFLKLHIAFALLSSFLFLFNTYMLLLAGGGQINLANACILGLFLLYLLIHFYDTQKVVVSLLPRSILLGFVIGLITVWDIRFAYITLLAYVLFLIIFLKRENLVKATLRTFIFFLFIPGVIAVMLNAFWVVPVIFLHQNPLEQLGAIYSTVGAVRFFSFAKLENSIGLLHPNWPENIFGLTHFMRPEFLLLPLLAYGSVLFIKPYKLLRSIGEKQEQLYILFFALLGLVGVFLAKGANDPFGGLYLWLFSHVPGFILFRDPSKWYFLVVISYIILIPYTLSKISAIFKEKSKLGENVPWVSVLIAMLLTIFLVKPAFLGQLGRTFSPHTLPQEYVVLEQFLTLDKKFSRVLWVPTPQRFGFYSYQHPAVSAEDFFHVASLSGVLDMLGDQNSQKLLQDAGIKYVIVPYDSEKEIFMKDRKYSENLHESTIQHVQHISWLKQISNLGKIALFEVPNPKDHFYLLGQGSVSYKMINPTNYIVYAQKVTTGEKLVFSESFDKYWQMNLDSKIISSEQYEKMFNSFILPADGSYTFVISYKPQEWVQLGLMISASTLILVSILGLIICLRNVKRGRIPA